MPYPGYVLSHVQFTMIVGVSYECKICSDTLRYQTGSVLTRQSGVSRFEAIVCCGALSACDPVRLKTGMDRNGLNNRNGPGITGTDLSFTYFFSFPIFIFPFFLHIYMHIVDPCICWQK